MADELDTAPKTQGFRDLPTLLTGLAMLYIARIMEIRSHFSFFFSLYRTLGEAAERFPDGLPDNLKKEGFQQINAHFSQSERQLINEIYLTRAIETFELYILTILREVFLACPHLLKSEGSIEIARVLELDSREAIVSHIAERKLHELSFKPLIELKKYISSRLGIDIFMTNELFETALLATEVRNLISHNDCIINEVFIRRLASIKSSPAFTAGTKYIITDEWLRTTLYGIDGIVFDFDEAMAVKFKRSRQNPRATIIDRMSATSVTFAVVEPKLS